MFGSIDVSMLFAGTILGIVLGVGIVLFLVYAAVNAARHDAAKEHVDNYGLTHWVPVTRHETQRAHLHIVVRDVEAAEW